jgi:hypothetical protein
MRLPSLAPLAPPGLADRPTPFAPSQRYALVLGGAVAAAPFAHALLQWMAVSGAGSILVCVGAADGAAEVAAAQSAASAVEAAHVGACTISVHAVGAFAGDTGATAQTIGLLRSAAEQGVRPSRASARPWHDAAGVRAGARRSDRRDPLARGAGVGGAVGSDRSQRVRCTCRSCDRGSPTAQTKPSRAPPRRAPRVQSGAPT